MKWLEYILKVLDGRFQGILATAIVLILFGWTVRTWHFLIEETIAEVDAIESRQLLIEDRLTDLRKQVNAAEVQRRLNTALVCGNPNFYEIDFCVQWRRDHTIDGGL